MFCAHRSLSLDRPSRASQYSIPGRASRGCWRFRQTSRGPTLAPVYMSSLADRRNMVTRMSTYAGPAGRLDDFVRGLQKNMGALSQSRGFAGAYMLVDRETG